MGPRSDERGESSKCMYTGEWEKVLQWGRALMSAERRTMAWVVGVNESCFNGAAL